MEGQDSVNAIATSSRWLRAAKRWLVWKSIPNHDPAKKPKKVPYYVDGGVREGALDAPEDVARLGSYADAQRASQTGTYAGLAFALGQDDGGGGYWQGVDLDQITERQLSDLANAAPGYVEMSPSGNGCHAIGYGSHFQPLGSNVTGIEAYASGRFFTWTGRVIRDAALTDIAPWVQQVLAPRHQRPAAKAGAESGAGSVRVDPQVVTELRSALLHMRSDGYDLWIRMGHALYELGEVGRGLWLQWSALSEKFDANEAAKKWDTFACQRTGYQAVFAEAQRQDWTNPNAKAAHPEAATADGAADVDNSSDAALPVPELRAEALYGILGEIAAAGSAQSEAVPAALAANTLARFCAVIGLGPHDVLGDERRSLRPWMLIVGPTSLGRKGTSTALPGMIFDRVHYYFKSWFIALPELPRETALSSGQGLVWMVRDPVDDEDPGVADKRLLLEISEFGGVLSQAKHETSTLTATMRDAFDGKNLSIPNKNSPVFATAPHIITVGHITREELTALLANTDIGNGFGNRFMMVYSARIKKVYDPQPTPPAVIDRLAHRIASAVHHILKSNIQAIPWTAAAKDRWRSIKDNLESRVRSEKVAKLMARDQLYVRMLAGAVALLNMESVVDVQHLEAALAWVDNWEATADFCYTTAKQYDEMLLAKAVADEIVEAVQALGGQGVKHTAVAERVSNKGKKKSRKAADIAAGVKHLQGEAPLRIRINRQRTSGREGVTYSLMK